MQDTKPMANTYHTARATGLAGLSLATLFARFTDWNEARRTRNILSKLSAHELDDIGLVPGDIDQIANRRF